MFLSLSGKLMHGKQWSLKDNGMLVQPGHNPEIVYVHCLCPRLKLAFFDVMENTCKEIYSKEMTALNSGYYFYKKSYKNKQALWRTWFMMDIKGTIPPNVICADTTVGNFGMQWLAHMSQGIPCLLRNIWHMRHS